MVLYPISKFKWSFITFFTFYFQQILYYHFLKSACVPTYTSIKCAKETKKKKIKQRKMFLLYEIFRIDNILVPPTYYLVCLFFLLTTKTYVRNFNSQYDSGKVIFLRV